MEISRELVKHIESLARLDLSESERDSAQRDLGSILDYVAQLDELDTSAVAPTTQIAESGAPLREDEPGSSLPREAALANAPDLRDGAFRVPPAISGEGVDGAPHA